jgi:hypothetical protein
VQAHVPGGQLGDDLAVLLLENVGVSPEAEPEGGHSSRLGVPVSR